MGLYLLIVNVVTFILYAVDKAKAKMDGWRISERMLMLFTIAGGSIGALAAMNICRHKTRTPKFRYGVPLIIALHAIIICCIYFR